MIEYIVTIIFIELVIYLAIKIVYWFDYTNSYIHCHHDSEPCDKGFNVMFTEEDSAKLIHMLVGDEK